MNNKILITLSKKEESIQTIKDIKKLLSYGYNPNVQDKKQYTPLIYACMNNNLELVKLLLKYNADPNIKNLDGTTSLMKACFYQTSKDLSDKILTSNDINKNIKIVKLLLKKYKYINDQNNALFTSLWYAVSSFNIKLVKLLLKKGADPNILCGDGNTVLINASMNKDNNIKMIKLLLKYKSEINIQNKNGFSPLFSSVIFNNVDAVKILLSNGANPNIYNVLGETPLMKAIINKNIQIIKLLLKYNAKINMNIIPSGFEEIINVIKSYKK